MVKKSKTRVLLVDDHKIVRQSIKAILDAQEDIKIIGEAEDGRQAVEMVKKLKPDVIVIDFAMPKLNGLEATYKIKRLSPKTKIMLLTAYDNEEYIYQILKAGASGFLLKDLAPSELVLSIETIEKGELFFSPQILKMIYKKLYSQNYL